jgi:catechol 2,3-dioxygenase-like lactoylglutathione lyase family enzyme
MPTILQNHYVLAVPNVERAAAFFAEVLGFSVDSRPPGWIFVVKDHCMVMLGECPDDIPPAELGSHSYFAYFRVDDAQAYRDAIFAKNPGCCGPIADKPWKMREFTVTTPDGHRLTIGQWLG